MHTLSLTALEVIALASAADLRAESLDRIADSVAARVSSANSPAANAANASLAGSYRSEAGKLRALSTRIVSDAKGA